METRVVALTSAQLAQLHPTVVAAAVATQPGEAIPVALAPAEGETDQADVSMDEPTVPVDLAEEPTSSGSAVAEVDMEQGKKQCQISWIMRQTSRKKKSNWNLFSASVFRLIDWSSFFIHCHLLIFRHLLLKKHSSTVV